VQTILLLKRHCVAGAMLLATSLPVCAQTAPTPAASPALSGAIRLSADQIGQAGIVTQRLDATSASPSQGVSLRLQGTAVLPNQAIELVSAPLAGMVQAVLVNPMQTVRAGQPIARIHSPQLLEWQRDYIQAQAQAGLAATKLKRDEALFQDGLVSESRLQDTRNTNTIAAITARERRLSMQLAGVSDAALRQLASSGKLSPELTISAPRTGSVIEVVVAPGQRVEMGAPLVKLADTSVLWVDLQATRAQGQGVRVGDAVQVVGCDQPGKISDVGVAVSATAQTMAVRATVPDAARCLRPNQFVEAAITSKPDTRDGKSVPATALARNGGRDYLFTRTRAGFAAAAVTVLSRDTVTARILTDLPPGAEIAVQGVATLKGAWLGMGVTDAAPASPAQAK